MGRKITPEEEELVGKEINQMLKKGAIIPRPIFEQHFTVHKKDGGSRLVTSLNKLNNFIHCPYFRMESLFLVRKLLSPNDRMCKVDLKDA